MVNKYKTSYEFNYMELMSGLNYYNGGKIYFHKLNNIVICIIILYFNIELSVAVHQLLGVSELNNINVLPNHIVHSSVSSSQGVPIGIDVSPNVDGIGMTIIPLRINTIINDHIRCQLMWFTD